MGRLFSRLNLAQKFLVFLLFASIIPLLAVGFISVSISSNILQEESSRYTAELVKEQKDFLDRNLEDTESLIQNIAENDAILEVLQNQDESENVLLRYITQANIGHLLDAYSGLQGVVSIDLFVTDGDHYHVGEPVNKTNIRQDIKDRLYRQALQNGDSVFWAGVEDNINVASTHPKVVTAARILFNMNGQTTRRQPAALLLVNSSPDYIYHHFEQIDLGEGAYLMVLDSQDRIVYHPDREFLGKQAVANIRDNLTAAQGSFVDEVNGQKMLATYEKSAKSQWSVISLVPLKALSASVQGIQKATLFMLALAFLLVFFSASVISRDVVKPIQQIIQRLKMFQEGTLELHDRLETKRKDEIGELLRLFNTFLESLSDKRRAEEALRQSEERFSLAVQGANDGIWDWDLESNYFYYSARWKSMLGFEEDQLRESPEEWFKRVHPEDIGRLKEDIQNHLNGLTAHFQNEHRLLSADGKTYLWVLMRGLAVRDENGKALRMAGSLTDNTTRKAYEEQLRHDAMYDSLTKLSNRAYFTEQVRHAIEHGKRRRDYYAAVLFMDLDRFKIVNDSLGHDCGDEMLTVVAQRLRKSLRANDTVARWGGDEFAVLLDDIHGVYDATQAANRVQEFVSLPIQLGKHEVFTSVSIGIAMVTSNYARAEDLLRDADTALNRAKSNGRARYEIFDANMHSRILATLNLEAELRRAVERQEFVVYYQPIISMKSGAPVAVEALLRWQHPLRGLILPGEYIWLLEDNGLIMTVGELVLRAAANFAKRLQESGFTRVAVSVNISARQFQNPSLPDLVQAVLKETGIPASALQLEITESAAMSDFNLTIEAMKRINALGVEFSIDDFGTSYSSLGYLKRFTAKNIKINQSFIQDIPANPDSTAIVAAIIAMAHILGMEVIAEGVETEKQLALLDSYQCDQVQGFLVSPALEENELLHFLRSRLQFLPGRETNLPDSDAPDPIL